MNNYTQKSKRRNNYIQKNNEKFRNDFIKKLFYILGMLFFSSCHLYQTVLTAKLSVEVLREGNLSKIKKLVDKGADINAADTYGDTILITTVLSNHTDVVNYLLEQNVDVNATNQEGVTALMLAARDKKSIEIFKSLLSHPNININESKENGITAWIVASTFKNKQAIELLIDYLYKTKDWETLKDWKSWAINKPDELTINLLEEKEKEHNSKNTPQSQTRKKQNSENIPQSQTSTKQNPENIPQSQTRKKQNPENTPQSQKSTKQNPENTPQSQTRKKQNSEACRSLWKTKP